jgi:hypothetical protein
LAVGLAIFQFLLKGLSLLNKLFKVIVFAVKDLVDIVVECAKIGQLLAVTHVDVVHFADVALHGFKVCLQRLLVFGQRIFLLLDTILFIQNSMILIFQGVVLLLESLQFALVVGVLRDNSDNF